MELVTKEDLLTRGRELIRKPEEAYVRTADRFVNFFEDMWFGGPINFGANKKLDKTCARYSNMAGTTCPKECSNKDNPQACFHSGCYAWQNEQLRPNVWNKDIVYSILALTDVPRLERYIEAMLVLRPKYVTSVRIHERGDMASQEELNMWARLAREFPTLNFYLYTEWKLDKDDKRYDWSAFDDAGCVWHPSKVHGYQNYGSQSYIDDLHKLYPDETYICPFGYTFKNGNVGECPCGTLKGSCNLCMRKSNNGKTPLFVAHGDAKKLTKDWKV